MEKTDDFAINQERFIAMPGINRFSERLEIAMNGTTNVALAAKCGISESAVRSYLKGKSFPGIDKIQAIAEACGAPMVWLITGDGFVNKTESIAIKSDSELSIVLSMMSSEQRKILAKAIIEHGVLGIVSALNGISAVTDFLQLPESERARVLRVYEQIKEGASQSDQGVTRQSLLPDEKQAG